MTANRDIARLGPTPVAPGPNVWVAGVGWVVAPFAQRNLILNGDFRLNQRVFSGGALAAGSYGYDRWGAYTGGASYSVSAGVVTLSTGTICQPVESPGLAGRTVTVSAESPSASLSVTLGTSSTNVSGSIPAGAGRQSVTLVVPQGLTGDVQLRLSGSSVSFSRIKLEPGSVATSWEQPQVSLELSACQRYYQKSYLQSIAPGSGGSANYAGIVDYYAPTATTNQINYYVKLGVTMRVTPTVTLYDLAGAPGKVFRSANGQPSNLFAVGEGGFNAVSPAGASGIELAFHWTAEAELVCTN